MASRTFALLSLFTRIARPFAVLAGLTIASAWAAPSPALNLTEDEARWLAAHPVIRVGVDPAYAPYSFADGQGRFHGVAVDFLERLGALLGVRIVPVPGLDWPHILLAARERRIDVVATVVALEERKDWLEFSKIYIPTPLAVVTRTGTATFAGVDDLLAHRVALVRGYSSTRLLMQRYPTLRVMPVDNPLQGLRAVAGGEADAYVGVLGVSTHLASKHGLTNLKVNIGYELSENGQRLGVREDWPELAILLDKALDALPEEEKAAIFRRWIPALQPVAETAVTELTAAERAWLAENPEVRVGFLASHAPFQFRETNGEAGGLFGEFVARFAARNGLRIQPVFASERKELIERLRSGDIDALAALWWEDGRTGLRSTRPYYRTTLMVFTRKGETIGGDVSALFGREVAVRAGGFAHAFLQRYPRIALQTLDNETEALRAVAGGRAFAMVGEAAYTLNLIDRHDISNLRAAAPLERSELAVSMALRSDREILAGILNKAIAATGPEMDAAIRFRWLGVAREIGWDPRRVLQWSLSIAALALLGYGVFWRQNRRLRQEVERRQVAEEEARRNSKELETFAYAISHDLKAPLRRIAGFSHILADDHAAQLDAEGRDFLGRIEAGAVKMDRMVDDLLAYSRLESRRIGRERIVLAPLLRELVEDRGGDEQYAGTAIRLEVPEGLSVLADHEGLSQVLRNLLDNALKYSRKAASPVVEIGGRREKDACLLWVRDNGAGFDMAQHDKIFEIFQRAHGEAEFPGTGVGLALVRRCVQRMGGRVWAESAPGQGATFHVELPA